MAKKSKIYEVSDAEFIKIVNDSKSFNYNPTDNRLENLRFLCPNCHTQTETYCSKCRAK